MTPALPFADLLTALRDRGMPVGVREHLAMGKLLARWDGHDVDMLRSALAALLARNEKESKLVQEAFNTLYLDRPKPPPPPPPTPPPGMLARFVAWIRWSWVLALGVAVVVVAIFWVTSVNWNEAFPLQVVPPVSAPPESLVVPPDASTFANAEPLPPVQKVDPWRVAALGLGAGLLAFSWRYFVRSRTQAQEVGRWVWATLPHGHPGPESYELDTSDLRPTLARAVLDDVAALLSRRHQLAPRANDIDVDRSLDQTLRAGLAPSIALRRRTLPRAVVALVDTSEGSEPFRPTIEELIGGLLARGVQLDVWRFHGDPSRLRRSANDPTVSLASVSRSMSEAPLIVIGDGAHLVEGEPPTPASWIATLKNWRHRVWVHPNPDPATWMLARAHAGMSVFGLDADGLHQAAWEVIGESLGLPESMPGERRHAAPLERDRMRWLISFLPHRDARAAELLRQRFAAGTPRPAVAAAWDAPPLERPWALAPSAEHVATYVDEVLDRSEPPRESLAHFQWRLDRAIVRLHIPRWVKAATAELSDLVRHGMAAQVDQAVGMLGSAGRARPPVLQIPARLDRAIQRSVGRELERQARESTLRVPGPRRLHFLRPALGEVVFGLVCGATVAAAAPWLGDVMRKPVASLVVAYRLTQPDYGRPVVLARLTREGAIAKAPLRVTLERRVERGGVVEVAWLPEDTAQSVDLEVQPGSWVQARGDMADRLLAVSNWLYVPDSSEILSTPAQRIAAKARQWNLGDPRPATPVPLSTPPPRSEGFYQHFARGSVYWSPQGGAHMIWGLIWSKWNELKWEQGPYGFPLTDELPCTSPDSGDRYQRFEGGVIYWKSGTREAVAYENPTSFGRGGNCEPLANRPAQGTIVSAVEVDWARFERTGPETGAITVSGRGLERVTRVELFGGGGLKVGPPVRPVGERQTITIEIAGTLPSRRVSLVLVHPGGRYTISVDLPSAEQAK